MRAFLVAVTVGVITPAWAGDSRICSGRGVVLEQLAPGTTPEKWAGPASGSGPYHDLFDPLLELSRAADGRIRSAAVKSLGRHVGEWRVEHEIRSILDNQKEAVAVRREALIALWSLSSRNDIRREIVKLAVSKGTDVELRIAAFKLFSQAACDDAEIRSLLHSALSEEDEAIRSAAAWGLWTDTANALTRQHLLSIAKNNQNGPTLRVEALRSLVDDAIEDWETQRLLLDLAEQKDADARVREVGVLGLSYLSQDWPVRRSLRRIADDAQIAVSLAAVRALGGPNLQTARYFEHIFE